MKAMILAAGLGTRLRPLTSNRPKALLPVGNIPVIDRLIQFLKGHSITEIIVNAHHHHHQIVDYLDNGRPFGIRIEVRVEPEILGTGGGIKNTADFWGSDPFIVINGDILTNIDLTEAFEAHLKNRSLATLILQDHKQFNQIQIDNSLNILDIATESRPGRLAFTGIHIIEPELLPYVPTGLFSSIIDCYGCLINSGKPIRAHVSYGHYWRDIGMVSSYVLANRETLKEKSLLLGSDCRIHSSAKLKGWAIIGEKSCLEEEVEIRNSILWDNVRVKKGRKVIDSIVTSSKGVEFDLIDKIF